MACERYLNAIHELVDGTLGPLRRAELELHLEACEACAALLADLREITRAAQSLPALQPPARTWSRIADQLHSEGRVTATSARGLRRPAYTMLALAAALVLAVGASLMLVIPRGEPQADEPTAAAPQPAPSDNAADANAVQGLAPGVASEWALTKKHYQNLIEEAKKPGSALPADVVDEVQANYLIMNDAMERTSQALESDPQNAAARQSFYEMLRQQIQFLQNTIALMNEMRQGDAAGAAEIVETGKS